MLPPALFVHRLDATTSLMVVAKGAQSGSLARHQLQERAHGKRGAAGTASGRNAARAGTLVDHRSAMTPGTAFAVDIPGMFHALSPCGARGGKRVVVSWVCCRLRNQPRTHQIRVRTESELPLLGGARVPRRPSASDWLLFPRSSVSTPSPPNLRLTP